MAATKEDDWINDTINEVNKLEEKFDVKCQEYDQKIENLERRVDELEGLVNVIERLEARIDDGEQYSRRMCLRINGVPIPSVDDKEDCVEKVHELIKETGVTVSKDSIDRAHRIGRVNDEGKQQIIVRFKSFRERTLVYRGRKNARKLQCFGSHEETIGAFVLGQGNHQSQTRDGICFCRYQLQHWSQNEIW
eukprot:Seg1464.14 transcript_id=Seg1464.14/GoldUCD/mRNA.D3Y31 product="hypothetical protein" protein_id=Seg1464.14/GoldUCD/D3Y31